MRPRVLMLAFACEPDEGSEPEVGWKWAHLMSSSCDVTVLTQEKNRKRIDDWFTAQPGIRSRPRFEYYELGPIWRRLKKRHGWMMHPYYWMWQFKLRGKVSELMRETSFDLVHHVTFASFRMPVFVRGLPFVWGPVGGADTAPWGLIPSCGSLAAIVREAFRNFTTFVAGHCVDLLVPMRQAQSIAFASTPETARLISRSSRIVRVMPTIGFDPSEAPPEKDLTDQGPLRLLFVGRLHPLKGLRLLLPALAAFPPDAVRLTIVGAGGDQSRLERIVDSLGIRDRITFAGAVPRENLASWFDSHDVLVAPSLYESGGLSVLEAFSRGMPAIVLDRGGHALSVGTGCGIKVDPSGSPRHVTARLKDAISLYLTERNRIRPDGARAHARLRELYSWDHKHELMLNAYREVCSREARD